MKVTIQKSVLMDALGRIGGLIEKKPLIPALAYVLITPAAVGVRLATTNIHTQIEVTALAYVLESVIPCLVNFKELKAALHGFKNGFVTLGQDEDDVGHNLVWVSQGEMDVPLTSMAVSRWPELLPVEGEGVKRARVPAAALIAAVRQTVCAAATTDNRPILEGLLFEVSNAQLTVVAADGYRLAVHAAPLSHPAAESFHCVIPAACLRSVIGMDTPGDVSMAYNPNTDHVMFQADGWSLTAHTLTGRYPDYTSVLPERVSVSAELDGAAWGAALREVSDAAADDANSVMCAFVCEEVSRPVLRLSAGKGDQRVTSQAVPLISLTDAVTFHIDQTFLRDSLTAFVDGPMLVRVGPAHTSQGWADAPLISTAAAPGSFHLIMPMTR